MRFLSTLVENVVRVAVGGVLVGFFLIALGKRRRSLVWIALRRTWRLRPVDVKAPSSPSRHADDDDEECPPSPPHDKQA